VQTLFIEDHVQSVAFNTAHEDMVAYAGPTTLCIRTASFKPYRQNMSCTVIGFQGSRLFCLDDAQLREEDVPLSSTVQQYIMAKKWQQAYEVACLGVTQQDWDALGQATLLNLELETARKAFVRTQDLLMLNLVHRMDIEVKSGVVAEVLKAEVLAHQVCTHKRFSVSSPCYF
jgi:intraflagellar transport protein 122